MKFFKNERPRRETQVFQMVSSPITLGLISTDLIENSKLVLSELFNLESELMNLSKQEKRFGRETKKFQIGVYVIYVKLEDQNILYVGATRDFKNRVGNHNAAFASATGHTNKSLQQCYNKIKLDTDFSHYEILENYFHLIPIFCYEIDCSEKDIQARSKIDFIVKTLEPKVKQAFLDTGKFTIVNTGAMLDKNLSDFQATSISLEKEKYYRKLGELAAAKVLKLQGDDPPSNLIDLSFFSPNEKKNLQNASRKIRPIISMKMGHFFSSYKQVCDTNWFDTKNEDTVSLRAKKDNPSLNKESRDFRFASNQEIVAQKYISRYDLIENPGRFNSKTTTFAKKSGIIGPKFPDQENMSNQEYSKLIEETTFSCTTRKTYYQSKVDAGIAGKVSSNAISKWVSRDDTLYKEFNMPIIWRDATIEENDSQTYLSQDKDKVPPNYDFSLETTIRIKTASSLAASRAQKGLIVPEKTTNKPKFIASSKEAQKYLGCSDYFIKTKMKDSEIAFLNNRTPRNFRTASLEENNNQNYIKKYDTLPLKEILNGLPSKKYQVDANIANFKADTNI